MWSYISRGVEEKCFVLVISNQCSLPLVLLVF